MFEVVVPKPGEFTLLFKLQAQTYNSILEEILILGTGKNVSHPPPSIRMYLNSIGIQLDVMDTVRPFAILESKLLTCRSGTHVRHTISWRRKGDM